MKKKYQFVLKKEKNNFKNHPKNSNFNITNILPNISKNDTNILETEKKVNSFQNLIELKNEEEEIIPSSKASDSEFNFGRWTDEEHHLFIKGILEFGSEWKMVQKIIKTRSSIQARSHAQKFFLKINNGIKRKNLSIEPDELIKYIYSPFKKINDGLPLKDIQKKRLLQVIISNIKKKYKENYKMAEIDSNIKYPYIEEEKDKESFVSDKYNLETKNNKIFILNKDNKNICKNKDLNNQKSQKIFSDKKLCGKKRKHFFNKSDEKKFFYIRKVVKNKYSNESKENKDKANINITDKPKIKTINLFSIVKNNDIIEKNEEYKNDNFGSCNNICPNVWENYKVNNNIIITNNFSNELNVDDFNNHINNFITIFNNMNNNISNNIESNYNNEFDKFNNFSQSINDFEKKRKYNSYMKEEFNIPKSNDFFNDNFISNDNNSFLSKENDEEFSITNKVFNFYDCKYFN